MATPSTGEPPFAAFCHPARPFDAGPLASGVTHQSLPCQPVGAVNWPLVGRAGELEAARTALGEPGAGVVIGGQAGVGKTRLADEVLADVDASGSTALRLVATRAAATIPFWAAAPLLGDPGEPGDSSDALMSAHRAVAELAAVAPVVVGVDDAHLLDEATARLLHQIADARQVRMVLTVRTGEALPEPVRQLVEDRGWLRLELPELPRDDVATLLDLVLEGEVESSTVDRLWGATQGNALFLRELCRDALGAGTLARHHGVWTWSAAPFTGQRLHDLVAGRVGRLDAEEHELAGLLALGEPLPVAVASALTSPTALEALQARGLVATDVVDDRPFVRLSHPLYAESVRARLGPLETTDIYAGLVEGMVKDVDELDADDRLRLAVWAVSSNTEIDPPLLVEAADEARQRDDPILAERLARAALGLPHGGLRRGAPQPPARGDHISLAANLALGEALGDQQRFDEAEAVLAPLAAVATDDAQRARIALARLASAGLGPDHLDDARTIAATTAISDRVQRETVLAGLAGVLSHAGALEEAGELALRLLDAPDEVVRLLALAPASAWLIHAGRAEQALQAARELFDVAGARAADVPKGRGWAVTAGVTSLLAIGQACDVEAVLQAAMDDPARRRDHAHSTLALLKGRTALARGRPATARRLLRESVVALERTDTTGRYHWALALLAEAEALLGDGDGARATLAGHSAGRESQRYARDAERARLWVTAAEGDVTGAIRQAIERADDAGLRRHTGFELLFLEVAVRLGSVGAAERLATLAPRVEGVLAATLGRLALAITAADGAELDSVARAFAGLGLDLHAAETATRAARAHRAAGASAAARASAEFAGDLRSRCEGGRTPAMDHGAAPGDLTRREREVAMLAVRGLSSRAIAERLDVSVRTVDNQLGRVYRKLNLASRSELRARAADLGLLPPDET
jgi:DNA-binding CsgD family transcriptional regulator